MIDDDPQSVLARDQPRDVIARHGSWNLAIIRWERDLVKLSDLSGMICSIRSLMMCAIFIGLPGCAEPTRERPVPADPDGSRGGTPSELSPKRIEMH